MKKFNKYIFSGFVFLILVSSPVLKGQSFYKIEGYVSDGSTNAPLEGANVFLSNTTLGSATNSKGYFAIADIPPGGYELVVSMIGYEAEKKFIKIPQDEPDFIKIKLDPKVYKTDEIQVEAERGDWDELYERFVRSFIGESENAGRCTVSNPEVLDLYLEENSILKAATDDWLEVINNALGYRIEVQLLHFSSTLSNITSYAAEVKFTEMKPDSDEQFKQWKINRVLTFNGSPQHFLYSIANKNYFEEGFRVYRVLLPRWSEQTDEDLSRPDMDDLVTEIADDEYKLEFPGYLRIDYVNESEEKEYVDFRIYNGSDISSILNIQTSWISLPYNYTSFNQYGIFLDRHARLKVFGYWTWMRLADQLPINYRPEKLIEK